MISVAHFKQWWLWLAACLIVVGLLVWSFMPAPVRVTTAQVQYGEFKLTVDDDAKTRVMYPYTISMPVSGRLLRVDHEEGDEVEEGAVLAVIQPSTPSLLDQRERQELAHELASLQADFVRAHANIEKQTALLSKASVDLSRQRTLLNKGYSSKDEFETADVAYQTQVKEVKASEQQAEVIRFNIEKIKTRLTHTEEQLKGKTLERINVTSPISGKVLKVYEKSESILASGAHLFDVADTSLLEVVADVLSTDAAQMKPGFPVTIKRWGGDPIAGRVRVVEPSGFTKVSALGVEEQRVNIIIDIVSPRSQWVSLGDGFRVDVEITRLVVPRALLVPTSALFRDGDKWAVFIIQQGRAYKRQIDISHYNAEVALVQSGLADQDSVVIYPTSELHDGARVRQG